MEKKRILEDVHPDPNLNVVSGINKPDVKLYDVRKPPFSIYGLYKPQTEPQFKRLPDDIASSVSSKIERLSLNTAGGRIRFSTDSAYIAIRAEMPDMQPMGHMAYSGTAGFDLYIEDPASGWSRFRKTFIPKISAVDGFESVYDLPNRKMRHFTIHFPLYSKVTNLFIGIQEDAVLGEGLRYREELPIVYYGSSITQGGCASRPGNAYTNMISRNMQLDHINLGFSGNCLGEEVMARYMASLPMLAFVSDYDHNAIGPTVLRGTHQRLYDIIREKHPEIPYIMISRPSFDGNVKNSRLMRDVIWDTIRHARANGDDNVWFIDGSSIFRGKYTDSCTVDGTHPNDLGFALFAEKVEDELRHAFMHRIFDF